jgi:hypothetical protein
VIELPEQAQPKAVARAAEATRAREADLAGARAAVVEANKAIEEAIVADREAYATALDAGRPDPGREAEGEARARLEECQRRLAVEEVRLQRAEVALREAIEGSLTAWQTALERATTEAEQQALEAVDRLRDIELERARRRLALDWTRSFQARKPTPGLGSASSARSTLLRNQMASPYDYVPVAELLDHVRAGIEQATLQAEAARLAERPVLHARPAIGLAGPVESESDAA